MMIPMIFIYILAIRKVRDHFIFLEDDSCIDQYEAEEFLADMD